MEHIKTVIEISLKHIEDIEDDYSTDWAKGYIEGKQSAFRFVLDLIIETNGEEN